jgi:hypothetical protein
MASNPFPGVDPYLESQYYWPDFHVVFVSTCRERLTDSLPDRYEARIDERIRLIGPEEDDRRLILPGMAITTREFGSTWPAAESGGVAVLAEPTTEPVTLPLVIFEEAREVYIEIFHRPDRSLVAVIELLSPENKVGAGFGQYIGKRNEIYQRPVHLVELDFLIGGQRLPLGKPLPRGDIFALVARANRRRECEVYARSIRRPLPTIKVPLLDPDPDLELDLAAVYETAYERGRYARVIDHQAPLTVPLAAEDLAWAEGIARASVSA